MNSADPAPKSAPFLPSILALDAAISYRLHALFKPYLPPFLLLLLEYSADFLTSFLLFLFLLFFFPSHSSLFLPYLLGLLLDQTLIGRIKPNFRRARPHYNPNNWTAAQGGSSSFPSGHASRVLLLATITHLNLRIEDGLIPNFVNRFIRVDFAILGIWIWAAVAPISRVLLGRHFFLDVLIGACLGVLEGVFAFKFLRF